MVESFKEIPFSDAKNYEELDVMIRKHLGIGFSECQQSLSESLMARAEELAEEIPSVAPYNNYDKFTEDKIVIANFLREEAHKPENWEIQFVESKKDSELIEFIFFNKAVDEGDILKGFVFVGLSGTIRHSFAQVNV